jgi:hypothetical protein
MTCSKKKTILDTGCWILVKEKTDTRSWMLVKGKEKKEIRAPYHSTPAEIRDQGSAPSHHSESHMSFHSFANL